MGMFDHIHYQGQVYQSKDFDCLMENYYIENGRLLQAVGHYEDLSPATKWQAEHPGEPLPPELDGLLGMRGCMSFIEEGRQDLSFHGVLNFYKWHETEKRMEEYNAKFTDGQLVSVEEVPERQHFGTINQ